MFLLFFSPFYLISQGDNANHKKYWYYKSRFNNDFIVVGTGDGESIPFTIRGEDAYLKFDETNNIVLKTGDGTSYLGYYIAALATEYHLLRQNNQNTDKVKHELFCALNAINRLDYKAEICLGSQNGNLNGFFVRDDVPNNFLSINNNYSKLNYFANINDNTKSRGFASKFKAGVDKISAGWSSYMDLGDHSGLFFESQDQVIDLLFGLAFVNNFVDANETDGNNSFIQFGSNETSLTQEARNIAARLVNYVKNSKKIDGNSCLSNISTGWHILDPVNCQPAGSNFDVNGVGDDAEFFSYPLAESGCFINQGLTGTGIAFSALTKVPELCPNASTSFNNVYSRTAGYLSWQASSASLLPSQPTKTNGDNRLMTSNLLAVCNCNYGRIEDKLVQKLVSKLNQVPILNWLGFIIGWTWETISVTVSELVPGYYVNNSSTAINVNSYYSDNHFNTANTYFDHAPLARKVLHGGHYEPNIHQSVGYLLDVMPCGGNYKWEGSNYPEIEWATATRLEHPEERGVNIFKGEYNGLDYMLYHNLWYIHKLQEGSNPSIQDLSDINVNLNNNTFPQASTINAYETIKASNVKFNVQSQNEYMRAGKTICFKPGTNIMSANTNSKFKAYIEPFACATDVGSSARLNNSNGDYDPKIKYHHQEYPSNTFLNTTNDLSADNGVVLTELALSSNIENVYNVQSKYTVVPTITSGDVNVKYKIEQNDDVVVEITNTLGQVFYSEKLSQQSGSLNIDITSLTNGMYLVSFKNAERVEKTYKIIKN